MRVYHVYDVDRISYWLLRCDRESGQNLLDPDKVREYAWQLVSSGRAVFLEIPGRGFSGVFLEDSPYREKVATPFGLVSTGCGILRALLKEIERVSKELGCTRIRINAGSERLLKFYKKHYDWVPEHFGTGMVTGFQSKPQGVNV